jgi:hypothetical protein
MSCKLSATLGPGVDPGEGSSLCLVPEKGDVFSNHLTDVLLLPFRDHRQVRSLPAAQGLCCLFDGIDGNFRVTLILQTPLWMQR